ncbi:MAG: DUF1573 domain-containing protein [Bacteroidales bacterium]|nr:DUF1573 domain-containing protein [Bacteroidales bacterium]
MNKIQIIVLALFLVSCAQNQRFSEVCSILNHQTTKSKVIYISGLGYASDSLYIQLKNQAKSVKHNDYYICDAALPDSRAMLNSFSISTLPALIRISSDNQIADVYNASLYNLDDWLLRGTINESALGLSRLKLYAALENNKFKDIRSLLSEIETDYSFYSLYLRCKSYLALNELSEYEKYRDKAISSYIQNPEHNNVLLFRELLDGYQSEAPIVIFDPLNINLGNLTEVGRYDYVIKYKNFSAVPFIIMDAISSCGCVKVNYNKVLDAYAEDYIQISYTLEEKDLGKPINRSVQLVTNLNPSYLIINIIGTSKCYENVTLL